MLTTLTLIGLLSLGYIGYNAGRFIGKAILITKALLDTSIRLSILALIITAIIVYVG